MEGVVEQIDLGVVEVEQDKVGFPTLILHTLAKEEMV